jgi:hypothetical protein
MWDFIIRTKRVAHMLPLLETILDSTKKPKQQPTTCPPTSSTQPLAGFPEDRLETPMVEFVGADLFD